MSDEALVVFLMLVAIALIVGGLLLIGWHDKKNREEDEQDG